MDYIYNELPIVDSSTFKKKTEHNQRLIREALQILQCLGIPVEEMSPRKKEKMAMAFLAVGDVKKSSDWKKIKDANNDYHLKTREIISFENEYFEENISSGSYDDIRRVDLAPLVLAEIVVESIPNSNTSDPRRGYKIAVEYARIIKKYGQNDWFEQVKIFNSGRKTFAERKEAKRNLPMIPVLLPDGTEVKLKDGEHNQIQQQIIQSFLPRFGNGAVVYYVGDSHNKYGVVFKENELKKIGIADLKQSKLPDVVAYSPQKDWIYMIEAYCSSNPITVERKIELENMLGDYAKKTVFVTAFINENAYRSCPEPLAWETEVWIATSPEHLIHRNGCRFLGPYSDSE